MLSLPHCGGSLILEVYLCMTHMKTCLLHRASLHVEHTNLVAVQIFICEHKTLTLEPAVGECCGKLQGKII